MPRQKHSFDHLGLFQVIVKRLVTSQAVWSVGVMKIIFGTTGCSQNAYEQLQSYKLYRIRCRLSCSLFVSRAGGIQSRDDPDMCFGIDELNKREARVLKTQVSVWSP